MQRRTIGAVANAQQTPPMRNGTPIAPNGAVALPLPAPEREGALLGIERGG